MNEGFFWRIFMQDTNATRRDGLEPKQVYRLHYMYPDMGTSAGFVEQVVVKPTAMGVINPRFTITSNGRMDVANVPVDSLVDGMNKIDAILETCRERARPVVLTALTAIFGVLPIAFGFNMELMNHETTLGAPSTQWWISLSSAIVFGLAFATILTLIVTPSMLMLVGRGDPKPRHQRRRWFGLGRKRPA